MDRQKHVCEGAMSSLSRRKTAFKKGTERASEDKEDGICFQTYAEVSVLGGGGGGAEHGGNDGGSASASNDLTAVGREGHLSARSNKESKHVPKQNSN
jgi:hypothetical protein